MTGGPSTPASGVPAGTTPHLGGTHHPAALCSPKESWRGAGEARGGQGDASESGAKVRGDERAQGRGRNLAAWGEVTAGLPRVPVQRHLCVPIHTPPLGSGH